MTDRTRIHMTSEEFIQRYEERPFELINGEIVYTDMTPTKFRHSKVSKRIYDALLFFLHDKNLGDVYFETTYIRDENQDNWVTGSRVPDVMFFEQSRIDTYDAQNENADDKPLALVPDLAVEVISPNDQYTKVRDKTKAYLGDGVKLIWIVDPQRQVIEVFAGDDAATTLTIEDTLTGGDVIDGFSIALSKIFEK